MKKKWLSMLLSCALLASSVMPSFTAVAADRGGADAAPAPTAAVEEAAPTAEEAAPVAETAPVAVAEAAPAADVPAATAATGDIIEFKGKKYSIDVRQDFETATDADVTVVPLNNGTTLGANNWGAAPAIQNLPVGSGKGYGVSDTSNWTVVDSWSSLFAKLNNTTNRTGEGIYLEIITNATLVDNQAYGSNIYGYPTDISTPNLSNRYYFINSYHKQTTFVSTCVKKTEDANVYQVFIPFTFYFKTQDGSDINIPENFPVSNFAFGLNIGVNALGGVNGVKGKYFYIDNIGFYSEYIEPEVPYSNTYTTWQNPLTTADVKIDPSDTNRLSLTFESGKAKITRSNADAGNWLNRAYFKLDPSELTSDSFIDFDFTTSENVPDDFALRFHLNSDSSANNEITSSEVSKLSYRTGSDHSYHYHIPVSDFALKDSNTLASANWLRVNFNSGENVTPIRNATFEYSNFKLVKGNDGTFEPGTEVVNVKPTVDEGGTLDVKVDADSNDGHSVDWSGLDHTANPSLQVKEGAQITLTAHPAEGMQTVWENVPDKVGQVKEDQVSFIATDDSTPSATFEEIPKHTVTIKPPKYLVGEEETDVPGATRHDIETQSITDGEEIDLSSYAEEIDGFTFGYWIKDNGDNVLEQPDKPNTFTILGDVTFTPIYTEIKYTVKAVKDKEQPAEDDNVFWSDSVGSTAGYKVALKDAVDLVPEKLGYHFDGWEIVSGPDSAQLDESGDNITLKNEDVVIAPKYAPNTPADVKQVEVRGAVSGPEGTTGSVEISAEGGSSETGSLTVAANKKVTLKAPDIEGKKFSHWVKGGADSRYIVSYEKNFELLTKPEGGEEVLYTAIYVEEIQPVKPKAILNVYSSNIYGEDFVVVFEWRDADAVGMEIGDVVLTITGSDGVKNDVNLVTYNVTYTNGYYTLTVHFSNGVPENFTLNATLTTKDADTVSATAEVSGATSLG